MNDLLCLRCPLAEAPLSRSVTPHMASTTGATEAWAGLLQTVVAVSATTVCRELVGRRAHRSFGGWTVELRLALGAEVEQHDVEILEPDQAAAVQIGGRGCGPEPHQHAVQVRQSHRVVQVQVTVQE